MRWGRRRIGGIMFGITSALLAIGLTHVFPGWTWEWVAASALPGIIGALCFFPDWWPVLESFVGLHREPISLDLGGVCEPLPLPTPDRSQERHPAPSGLVNIDWSEDSPKGGPLYLRVVNHDSRDPIHCRVRLTGMHTVGDGRRVGHRDASGIVYEGYVPHKILAIADQDPSTRIELIRRESSGFRDNCFEIVFVDKPPYVEAATAQWLLEFSIEHGEQTTPATRCFHHYNPGFIKAEPCPPGLG